MATGNAIATHRAGLLEGYFYFFMSLLIAAVVVFGFSQTVEQKLIHAAPPRPFLLYVHGAVFFGWVFFFILQSGLVRARLVHGHASLDVVVEGGPCHPGLAWRVRRRIRVVEASARNEFKDTAHSRGAAR